MSGSPLRAVHRWLAHQVEPVRLDLLCTEGHDPAPGETHRTAVRLEGCAAELAPHELVELLTLGAEHVTVTLAGCADAAGAVARVSPVVGVLRAGGTDRIDLAEAPGGGSGPAAGDDAARPVRGRRRRRAVLDAAHLPIPRRRALGIGGGPARDVPFEYADPQERLLTALRALLPASGAGLDTLPGPGVRLAASGCTTCGVCVQACPAEALSLRHGAAGARLAITTLVQRAEACTGCRRCVDLCPSDALAATGTWSWAEMLGHATAALATLSTARCERCGTRFPAARSERWCEVCAYRRQNPFGSAVPPGARRPARPADGSTTLAGAPLSGSPPAGS